MVELAILMPLLVIVVFGVIELGRALYQQQAITKAATAGARFMSRVYEGLNDDCSTNPEWTARVSDAQNLVVFGGGSNPIIPGLSVGDVSISAEERVIPAPNDNVCVVVVTVESAFVGAFGTRLIPMTTIGTPTLNARAEEVYIGE